MCWWRRLMRLRLGRVESEIALRSGEIYQLDAF